ncbi:MAG TPA: hypothetical protein VFQ25_07940 [Ktedonobacterales bacterium]|nr:hypothetical protein [Ktedonobacterales bacterium]
MRSRRYERDAWENQAGDAADYGDYDGADESAYGYDNGQYGGYSYDDGERGLILQTEQSLVGVSSTVTEHGAPLLSYTRTMSRFYNNRRQRLSLGRYSCEVCGDRIRLWAWETPNGNRTHDGCYERLAWTWTNLYAAQQRMADEGRLG